MPSSQEESIRNFWDQRAALGDIAGTNDFVLTSLEQRFLVENIEGQSRVMDIGCGNGATMIKLATEKKCSGIGFDFSSKMIESAVAAASEFNLAERIEWYQKELPPVPSEWGLFDVAYSQRSLINLTNSQQQREAVISVAQSLKCGGKYLMVECFNEGAEETNLLRARLGLEVMKAPWHNLFFNLHEVKSWSTPEFYVEKVVHISSLYHFLSRVIYAKLCQDSGDKLIYDSKINLLASQLPQEIGKFGPVKACIWKKS